MRRPWSTRSVAGVRFRWKPKGSVCARTVPTSTRWLYSSLKHWWKFRLALRVRDHSQAMQVRRDYIAAGAVTGDDVPLAEGGDGAQAYSDAMAIYLGFAADKAADYWSGICSWHSSGEFIRNTFSRQAIPMVWDYAETNPLSSSTGNWLACVDWVRKVIDGSPYGTRPATVLLHDAATLELPGGAIVATDPPYYDNVPYSDISDFFYVWLRRSLGQVHPALFKTLLTPKANELVAFPHRFGGDKCEARRYFEAGLGRVTGNALAAHAIDYPMTLFYAYKQAEAESSSGMSGSRGIDGMGDDVGRDLKQWFRHHGHMAGAQRTREPHAGGA